MKQLQLTAEKRAEKGRSGVSRMRKAGRIPGVVYGESGSLPLSFQDKDLKSLLRETAGHAVLVKISIDGDLPRLSIVADYQRDPLTGRLIHVDFHEVSMRKKMHAAIPLRVVGQDDCAGVRLENGVLEVFLHQVEVSCLPAKLPEEFVVDVTDLKVGESVHMKDLVRVEGVDFLSSDEAIVVACSTMKQEESAAAEGEEGDNEASGEVLEAGTTGDGGKKKVGKE